MAKIMLALDGTVAAEQALADTLDYCGENDELVLIRVAFPLPTRTIDELELDRYLQGVADRARGLGLRNVTSVTCFGSPVEQLVQAAQQREVDLLVLRSHTQGWKRWVLGSVSEKVAREATCPVLVSNPLAP